MAWLDMNLLEENEIIIPAIQDAKSNDNILVFGPYSADSFFTFQNLKRYDAVLCMYHDQGLIPFKTLNYPSGVNLQLDFQLFELLLFMGQDMI